MGIGWGHWGSLNSVLRPWECNNNYGVNMEGGASESQSVSPLSQLVVGAGSIEEEGGVGGSSRRQVGR